MEQTTHALILAKGLFIVMDLSNNSMLAVGLGAQLIWV